MPRAILSVKDFAARHQLYTDSDKIILAVSGGRDSMCMLSIFRQMEIPIAVAHMNFQLRGAESDGDETFVQEYCHSHDIPCYVKKVDCRAYMSKHKKGLQEAARDLRYAWMSSLLKEAVSDHIATAHHQDDNAETVMINLMRGTGLRGLTGIPLKRGNIVRPMMCFNASEIISIANDNQIEFRQDSSNEKDDYLRNRIRHHLIPLMNEIHPGASQNVINNISRIKDQIDALENIAASSLERYSSSLNARGGSLELHNIKNSPSPEYLLSRVVSRYGFTLQQCSDIVHSAKTSDVIVSSTTHDMIIDRDNIVIEQLQVVTKDAFTVHIGDTTDCGSGIIQLKLIDYPPFDFNSDVNIELIPADRLQDGAIIRSWMEGDRFSPLGMNGSQKVSDLLTNLKFSTFQKRRVKVLTIDDSIAWVIGVRLSEAFKLKDSTQKAVKIIWKPGPNT